MVLSGHHLSVKQVQLFTKASLPKSGAFVFYIAIPVYQIPTLSLRYFTPSLGYSLFVPILFGSASLSCHG
jgi:hypothetical protein